MEQKQSITPDDEPGIAPVLIGAGLVMASMIILPAVAQRIGAGTSLTGALRAVLMKASQRVNI